MSNTIWVLVIHYHAATLPKAQRPVGIPTPPAEQEEESFTRKVDAERRARRIQREYQLVSFDLRCQIQFADQKVQLVSTERIVC